MGCLILKLLYGVEFQNFEGTINLNIFKAKIKCYYLSDFCKSKYVNYLFSYYVFTLLRVFLLLFVSLFLVLLLEFYISFSCFTLIEGLYPAGDYILKANNRNTGTRCEICSKLTIKTTEPCLYC